VAGCRRITALPVPKAAHGLPCGCTDHLPDYYYDSGSVVDFGRLVQVDAQLDQLAGGDSGRRLG
jgi:hypothetical protein